jgi:teichuronic acid biosynthesis glycosyltransferase TuaG
MRTPFYSILVPVYNAIDTLEDCLESICEQSFSDYEIIICNDGSTDGSEDWLEAWLETKPGVRISLIHQENKGLGAARNTALSAAEGRFCALLDADDIWHPSKLKSCWDFLHKSPECEVLYHGVENFGLSEGQLRRTFPIASINDLLELGNPLVPSASILKTETLKNHFFQTNPAYHGAEDLYLWMELLLLKTDFIYWPETLTYYREEGGMSSNIDEHLNHVLAVLQHFYGASLIKKTVFEKANQRKYYEAARFYQKRGQHHQAHRYYAAADSKSLKVFGLKMLNALGFNF